jgi:V8-like Glu-specific endopeptidase
LLTINLIACGQKNSNKTQVVTGELIGGSEVVDSEKYNYVIKFSGGTGCTGAKVAKSLYLTASHCVMDFYTGELSDLLSEGKFLTIETKDKKRRATTIAKVYLNPSYHQKAKDLMSSGQQSFLAGYSHSDIAFIKINDEFSDIPKVDVSYDRVIDDNKVILTGYGCEESINKGSFSSRLKSETARTLEQDKAVGIWGNDYASSEEIYITNFLTKGAKNDESSASLCPGDSGGPVLQDINGKVYVVGVNAYYLFEDFSGVSTVNLHARFDFQEIRIWMEDILLNYIK